MKVESQFKLISPNDMITLTQRKGARYVHICAPDGTILAEGMTYKKCTYTCDSNIEQKLKEWKPPASKELHNV